MYTSLSTDRLGSFTILQTRGIALVIWMETIIFGQIKTHLLPFLHFNQTKMTSQIKIQITSERETTHSYTQNHNPIMHTDMQHMVIIMN